MSDSLRDQLLKAGLVTSKQARQAERDSKQQQHRQPRPSRIAPPAPATPQPAQSAKAARDLALNRQRQEAAEAKARAAQVRQLVEQQRLPRIDSDEHFNFVDRGKVRRVAIDGPTRARLLQGQIAIARCDRSYVLVPLEAAARIRERDPSAIVTLSNAGDAPIDRPDESEHPVPDDLIW